MGRLKRLMGRFTGAFETPHGAFGIVASIDGFYATLRVPDHSLDQHSGGGHRRTTYEMPNASQLDGGLETLPIMISLDGTVVSFRSEQTFNWPLGSKQIVHQPISSRTPLLFPFLQQGGGVIFEHWGFGPPEAENFEDLGGCFAPETRS